MCSEHDLSGRLPGGEENLSLGSFPSWKFKLQGTSGLVVRLNREAVQFNYWVFVRIESLRSKLPL